MRCKFCDYCPTAPSISTLNDRQGVRLTWSDEEQGWTCGNQCGIVDSYSPYEEDELVEVVEVPAAMSET